MKTALLGISQLPAHLASRLIEAPGPMATPCWQWTAWKNTGGYGIAYVGGRAFRCHRLAYEAAVEPIPADMTIDHLCRNRACANPAHMEVVTAAENVRRAAAHRKPPLPKTHCPQGHELSGWNLYVTPQRFRACKTCKNADSRRRRRLKSAGTIALPGGAG